MKILVTGACGQLGSDVVERAITNGFDVIATGIRDNYPFELGKPIEYAKLDITDERAVSECLSDLRPDAVIHCAAWTAVDLAEKEENKSLVRAINYNGTLNIAKACKKFDAKMLYISTDYVFNGKGSEPWDSDSNEFEPVNYYGQTKFEGEIAIEETLDKYFIVRISWVFGRNGNNFVKTMLKLAETHDTLTVVDDQIGRPTNTYDLAKLLCEMIVSDKYGIYNATNEGEFVSWCDFAKEIFKVAGKDIKVLPVSTEEYNKERVTAPRPLNSRMKTDKIVVNGFTPLKEWKQSLADFIKG